MNGKELAIKYADEIQRFKNEGWFFMNRDDKGCVWICRHVLDNGTVIENLTVEPGNNEQYEIAVRFPKIPYDSNRYNYSGYHINQHGTLSGFGTNGH
jgi:hypothetical protein